MIKEIKMRAIRLISIFIGLIIFFSYNLLTAKIKVVTTFSDFASITKEIGGDHWDGVK